MDAAQLSGTSATRGHVVFKSSFKVNLSMKWPLKEAWKQAAGLFAQLAALMVVQYILYLNWPPPPLTQSQALLPPDGLICFVF